MYQLANKIHLFGFLETHVGEQNAFRVIDKDCEEAGVLLQLYLCFHWKFLATLEPSMYGYSHTSY